jgi:hypothetical protein
LYDYKANTTWGATIYATEFGWYVYSDLYNKLAFAYPNRRGTGFPITGIATPFTIVRTYPDFGKVSQFFV